MQGQMQESPNFSLKTHEFDNRGRLIGRSPYRLHIVGQGEWLFERPVNSGNLYYANNEAAGRVEYKFDDRGIITGKVFDLKAAHKAYEPPKNADEKRDEHVKELVTLNARLQAELDAIKKEQLSKAGGEPLKQTAGAKPAGKA